MAKWTEDLTYKFVEEYLKYECLHNPKDSKHFNKETRDAALLKISETMNISDFGIKEVYTKIRNLKSTFSQESKKVKNSLRSGAGTDVVYVPRMKWYKLLDDALNSKNVQCRDSQSNKKPASGPIILEEEDKHAEKHNPDPTPGSPIPRKRTIRDLSRLVSKVQTVADTINGPTTATESEFDVFGKMVSVQLKNLPLHTALQAQMFIQTYLCKLRLKEMGHEFYDHDDHTFSPYHDNHTQMATQQSHVLVEEEDNKNSTIVHEEVEVEEDNHSAFLFVEQ